MQIPTFTLPSDSNRKIKFVTPTVGHSLQFAELNTELEEASTTEFLNALQDRDFGFVDSREWTEDDRRTALWWIYISSVNEPTLAFNYECEHCGEEHVYDLNLASLADGITELDNGTKRVVEATILGEKSEVIVRALSGADAERLEQLRFDLRDAAEQSEGQVSRALLFNYALTELALHIELPNEPEGSAEERIEYRVHAIKSMPKATEYAEFSDQVTRAIKELEHGLTSVKQQGQVQLVTPPHECPNKGVSPSEEMTEELQAELDAKEPVSTALLIPFRADQYISAF